MNFNPFEYLIIKFSIALFKLQLNCTKLGKQVVICKEPGKRFALINDEIRILCEYLLKVYETPIIFNTLL